jgi:limonene-1,2-epoxide hydrolase
VSDAQEIVDEFLKVVAKRDYDRALPMLAEDIEYQNMMMPPIHGREAVRETLEMLLGMCADSEWVVHRELTDGTVVMNERSDRFHLNGEWFDLPVMGVFEVRDGLIATWRDYFDLATVTTKMFPEGAA